MGGGRGVANRYETRNHCRKGVGPRVYVFRRRRVPIIDNEREQPKQKNTTKKNRNIKKNK